MFSKPVSTLAVLAQMAWALSCGAFADEPPKKEEGKPNAKPVIAHIKISGSMDENPTDLGGLFASTPPETLKTLQERIEKAAKDPNVAGVLLEVGELSVGWGKLDEIEASIGKLRKAGKKIFAWTASEDTKEYLVAAMADEVAIPESVSLMIVGVRSSVTFYKELFDLIGVRADMLKVGDFKSAVEPYTRSNLSEPARKQLASMLDDFFDKAIVERIAKYRKAKGLTEEKVRTAIDEAPWVATRAKELGMVDTLAYFENFAASLPQQVGKPTATIARNYAKPKSKDEDLDLSNPFALLKALSPPKAKESKNPKVAVIHAVGEIVTGKGGIGLMGEEAVGSTTLIEAIQKAETTPRSRRSCCESIALVARLWQAI